MAGGARNSNRTRLTLTAVALKASQNDEWVVRDRPLVKFKTRVRRERSQAPSYHVAESDHRYRGSTTSDRTSLLQKTAAQITAPSAWTKAAPHPGQST